MNWLTRLVEKLKSFVAKGSAENTSTTSAPAAPVTPPAPTEVVAEEPAEPEAAADEAEEPAEAAGDPAINKLDSEREAAKLPETPAEETPSASPEPVAEAPAEPAKPAEPARPAEPEAPATVAEAVDAPAAGEEGPFGPGSAKPLPDGAAPGEDYTVKGKKSSKLFHTAESPYFGRTKADVWFKSPSDAENAGFAAWNHKKKAAAK